MRREKFWVWALRSFLKVATALFVVVSFVVACVPVLFPPWEVHDFPEHIQFKRVVASQSDLSIRDGCSVAFLELKPDFANRLRSDGLPLLNTSLVPRGNQPGNFVPNIHVWKQTPAGKLDATRDWREALAEDRGFARLGAGPSNGCWGSKDIIDPKMFQAIEKAMADGRAYYSVTGKRYGLLVIVPETAIVGAFYWY